MKHRRLNYNGDIDKILEIPIAIVTILTLFSSVIFACYDSSQSSTEYVQNYNAKAAVFNALPKSDRELFQTFFSQGLLDSDLFITPKEMPSSTGQLFLTTLPWFLLVLFAICTITTFICYWYKKDGYYHLADLPLSTTYNKILLITILPIGWPFLLGSRIIMWRENYPRNQAEKAEVKRLAHEELTLEPQNQPVDIAKNTQRVYIDFRTKHFRDIVASKANELQQKINDLESNITDYGQKIMQSQHQLGEFKAKLRQLEKSQPDHNATRHEAFHEWQQIIEMRGVAKISTSSSKVKKRNRYICILIKVRVPYADVLYDFGDYEVKFYESDFQCRRVRSGIRLNCSNTIPTYPDGKYDFCFGDRRHDIEHYAASGRIVEALTLIIDCFHSVNPGDERYIPGCYRRVETVEKTKKFLKHI